MQITYFCLGCVDTEDLNHKNDQFDLINMYRTWQLTAEEHTYFHVYIEHLYKN